MKTIFTLALATAALAGYFSSYTPNAPQEPMPVFSMPDIKPRVHPWKTYHDRIEPETELYRQPRCKTPGTVYWDGKCFRPERIPRS